jgi:hypothetical protein
MPINTIAMPCQSCLRELSGIINRPARSKMMIEGFLFYYCEHRKVHVCWTEDGHIGLQHCASVEHGNLINGGYVAAGTYHRHHLAQLLASELARSSTARSSDAKPNDDDDRTVLHA